MSLGDAKKLSTPPGSCCSASLLPLLLVEAASFSDLDLGEILSVT